MATTLGQSPTTVRSDSGEGGLLSFEPFELPASNQRKLGAPHPNGAVIPLALEAHGPKEVTLVNAIDSIRRLQQSSTLTNLLATHGALLFRDLPISSVSDFSRFAHAFNYSPHEIIGIVVDRKELAPNVAPANEAPPNVLIYNHNESPQVPHAPEYIMFYGHVTPECPGGETPISSSLELFQKAQERLPEFMKLLTEKGILSRVRYYWEAQYLGGSSLEQAFGKEWLPTDDLQTKKVKVESQIGRYNRGQHTTWTWTETGLVVEHRLPAIRTQQSTNLPTMFTALAAYYQNPLVNKSSPGRAKVTEQLFGDGTEIPPSHLKELAAITDEIKVLHRWQKGDVLVFDNVIAQHGRQPWQGEQHERVIYASLWDGESVPGRWDGPDTASADQALREWAQVVPALWG